MQKKTKQNKLANRITCNGDGGIGRDEGADGIVGQALVHALVAVAPPRSLVQHLNNDTNGPSVTHWSPDPPFKYEARSRMVPGRFSMDQLTFSK